MVIFCWFSLVVSTLREVDTVFSRSVAVMCNCWLFRSNSRFSRIGMGGLLGIAPITV